MPFRKDKKVVFKDGQWYSNDVDLAVAIHTLDYKQLMFSINDFDTYWNEIHN